jgi:hypothetical protein
MRKSIAGLAATVLLATGLAGPAKAGSRVVPDGRDAPASADITSATYVNGAYTVRTSVQVRDLRRYGQFQFTIAVPDSDVGYLMTVWIKPDGTVARRLTFESNFIHDPTPCRSRVSWDDGADKIFVSVPHSCISGIGFLTRAYIFTRLRAAGERDGTAVRIVGRGDSPGCVTNAEYNSVRRGLTMARVHRTFDTPGRVDPSNVAQTRVYRICGVGEGIYVSYRRDSSVWRVTGKSYTDD